MKKVFPVFICFFFYSIQSYPQNRDWLWARGSSGAKPQEGNAIAADSAGNAYITGYFQGDSITFDSITLYNQGNSNMFVAKYSPTGNLLWATCATPSSHGIIQANSIATDANGNVFVTGFYQGDSIGFGGTILDGSVLGYWCSYIIKYNTSGNIVWVKTGIGTGNISSYSIAIDLNGNAYITGYFDADTITLGSTVLLHQSPLNADAFFIIKYDSSGNVLWAKTNQAGTNGEVWGTAVTTDKMGNAGVTGLFDAGTAIFDNDTLNSPAEQSIFTLKYDTSGNVLWARSAASTDAWTVGIAADGNNNIYICGTILAASITFDNIIINDSTNYTVCFIAKYDAAGNLRWAKGETGGNVISAGYNVATDVDNNVYFTGAFAGNSITFDATSLRTISPLSPNDVEPIFIVLFDPSGNVLCASALPSGGDDKYGFCINQRGEAYVGADFADIIFIVGGDTWLLTGPGDENIYVAKFSCTGCTPPPVSITVYGDTLSGLGAAYYQWLLNGTPITGATSSVFIATIPGSYSLQVTDTSGCVSVSNPVIISEITQPKADNNIIIYPNPSSGNWQVTVSDDLIGSTAQIFDATGRIISRLPITQSKSLISLPGISTGIYEIRFSSPRCTEVRKLIKL
jgi:hypothetical protein